MPNRSMRKRRRKLISRLGSHRTKPPIVKTLRPSELIGDRSRQNMASEKAAKILWKMEAPFTREQIEAMPEGQAWGWILPRERKLREDKAKLKLPQICFTGFKDSEKEKLRQ